MSAVTNNVDSTNLGQGDQFSKDSLSAVSDHVARVGCGRYIDETPAVGVTSLLATIARQVARLAQASGGNITVTDSSIVKALMTLLALRCLQVQALKLPVIKPQDVPVPDFFRPFLSCICKVDDAFRSLRITPCWDPDLANQPYERTGTADSKNAEVSAEDVENMRETFEDLKVLGLRVTLGLPRITSTESDGVYRICEGADGALLVAGSDVGEADLLMRSVVRVQFLSKIFGEARTRYMGVEDLRQAVVDVVAVGFRA